MGNDCSKGTWRNAHPNLKWNLEFMLKLENEIKVIPTFRSVKPCLLLTGPMAAGKSAVVNTFLSAGKKHLVQKAVAGADEKSVTVKYGCFDAAIGEPGHKFRVCDTLGMLAINNKGITANDTISVIRGHIAPGYEFQENHNIHPKDDKYISDPRETDKSHCLVIVLSCEDLQTYQANYIKKVMNAIHVSRKEDIPVCMVLTKVDRICDTVRNDNSKIFTCDHVKDAVRFASERFCLPEGYIFPMINYTSQVAKPLGNAIDIIALLTLKTLLQSASDFLEGHEFK